MDVLEQLRSDIATLISTASDTIGQLVTEATARATATVATVVQADPNAGVTAASFTSQLTQLSQDVQAATQSLKDQAAVILGATQVVAPAAPVALPVTPVAAPSVPDPADLTVTLSSGALLPDVSPVDPNASGVTIGPNSFKAGA